MMWNDVVEDPATGTGHGVRSGADDAQGVGLPRPRSAPHGDDDVMTQTDWGGASAPLNGGHAAAIVSSEEALLTEATRFVQAGLDASDLVVVGGTPAFLQVMAEEFGDADGVEFDDGVRLNSKRAPDAFGHLVKLSDRAAAIGSGRLRVLAQVDYSPDPRAIREFVCFEAAANLLPATSPTSVLCIYDTRRLAPELVDTASCTHAAMVQAGRRQPNVAFVDPHDFVRGLDVPDEPLQDSAPLLAIDDAASLADLRHALGAELARSVPAGDTREDLHLAISEMAANAFRHGGRPVGARLWASDDRLVVTISDGGRGVDPLRGYWPAHGRDLSRGGMGLWLARKLCDHVDLVSDEHGTTVRLATALR
jgi:anti-sigma regulatory factor (Ser/Thr protein kinase)